jgi:hypothetical protein
MFDLKVFSRIKMKKSLPQIHPDYWLGSRSLSEASRHFNRSHSFSKGFLLLQDFFPLTSGFCHLQ